MEQRHLQLGYHLVAFLDVLGQRERFRELKQPRTAEESVAVAEVLRQTAGFVLDIRRIFGEQFQSFEAGLTYIKKETNAVILPRFVGFSDSFVTSVPLNNQSGELVPIITVFSALAAAAIVMLTSLASRHSLRGGIDVGLATEIGPQEIYGTALERAYVLESREAESPRILIGDELWRYLEVALANFEMQTGPAAKANAGIVKRIMELITIDSDGKRILDYLGPIIVEHAAPGNTTAQNMVWPAYRFVLEEQKRFHQCGDPKLGARYRALRGYFESRLSLWNLDPKKT
jgi:hypothetical protein